MAEPQNISIFCPHCHRYTAVSLARTSGNGTSVRGVYFDRRNRQWWIGVCNHCSEPVLVQGDGAIIFPTPLPKSTPDSIPQPMRSDLDEAKKCLAAGCLVAAAIMARRVIQGACVHQGADQGTLVAQTQWLLDNHVITAKQRAWMDALRWLGNMGAHPNKEEVAAGASSLTAEAVRSAVEVAEQFLTVLYVTDGAVQQVLDVARPNASRGLQQPLRLPFSR